VSKQRNQNIRVGVFVAAALAVLIMTVFVIGQERSMFTRKTRLNTSFADINGLVIGAPVRLAGVDVGRVTKITFSEDLSRPEARVELAIENQYAPRVRKDSVAFIDSKGLLGDKLINLSVGSPSSPQLQEGEYITPKASLSIEAMAKDLQRTASAIGDAAESAEVAINRVATPEVTENLRRISGSLAAILERIEKSELVPKTEALMERATVVMSNSAAASARVDRMLARVEQGPGNAHSLVYGNEVAEMAGEWKRAATGIADLTQQINHGDGLVSALLHDENGKKLVHDLTAFTERLNRISSDIERGRGTLGGLIVDPSVYEEMKTILGNIERNVMFKSLVRMTIKEEGLVRPATMAKPAAQKQ
jgi:phospholipid/cholesterol/gamma-HCH transport system substrate-binding protein